MSTQDVASAVQRLKKAVLSDPDLAKMVENVKSPSELAQLWQNERFRQMHDKLVGDVKTEDVRAYLGELRDSDLDQVTGGALNAYLKVKGQAVGAMSPSEVYSTVFFQALNG